MKEIALILSIVFGFLQDDTSEYQTNDSRAAAFMAAATVSVTNHVSDYYYFLNWNELNTGYCNCSQTTSITAAMNSFQSGNNWYSVSGIGSSGSTQRNVGPSANQLLYVTVYYTGESEDFFCIITQSCSAALDALGTLTGQTSSIYAPTNVQATDGDHDTQVVITWDKGTHIPDAQHSYRIYRGATLVGTVAGTVRTFTDTGLMPGQSFNYSVRTYTTAFGTHESGAASDQGSTFSVGTVASKGVYANRVLITWNDLSDIAEDIRVERSIPGSMNREELAIMNKTAKSYNDQGGIPGYSYTYFVTPLSASQTYLTGQDNGYSKPNGSIKGHVRSKFGAGVPGVDIDVVLLDMIPAGGVAVPCPPSTYCTTTDADGFYEIRDIYYYTGAEFSITPSKTVSMITHVFTPSSSKRTLDENVKSHSGVDFTDETVFTVAGRVTYPPHNNVTCGIPDATILLNDNNVGIKTDDNGDWSFAISDEGTYVFSVEYFNHEFENSAQQSSTSVLVDADVFDIDFEDTTTDDLRVIVQGGCQASLADSIHVLVTAPEGCFYEEYTLDENGFLIIEDLPARDYSVSVLELFDVGNPNIANIFAQIGGKFIDVDLTFRDTATTITETDTTIITPADTLYLPNGDSIFIPADTAMHTIRDTSTADVFPEARFIYRSPLIISVDWAGSGATETSCPNSEGDDIILMEQGINYILQIEVKESLGNNCYVDSGYLKIYDFVSDRGNTAIRIPIKGGIATYVIEAGEPEIAESLLFHNHEKLFYVIPEVDLAPADGVDFWLFVTGTKSNTPSFITRSPDIPMIILHDPPGNQSYSYIEKGQSFRTFTTNEVQVGGEAGIFLNLLLGAKIKTPFSGHGFGTIIKFSAVAGRDNFDRDGIETTITFNEKFQTSDAANLTGHAGDVYIGAAFNQGFSLAERLQFFEQGCNDSLDIIPAISVESFATTFVYTELHVKNTLLPTLGFLIKNIINGQDTSLLSEEDKTEVNKLRADSIMWSNIVHQNAANRDTTALFTENISFSAGAQVSKDFTRSTTRSASFAYNAFLNSEFALGAKIDNEGGIWFDSELGVMGAFRLSVNTETGFDTTLNTTIGYVLDDSDIGDFFSVDILEDTVYSVPAFRLKLGTSSCPQEPGTQARDRPRIKILPPEINNVPSDGAANFVCQLTNLSESFETREYNVRVITTTNPDGAQVALGSESINNFPQAYFLERGQTLNVNLSVARGPIASNYENIGVMIYPECEYDLWQNNGTLINGDTAFFSVNFLTECTNVSLVVPDDGWLVNQNDTDLLRVTFSGYDINNPYFTGLTLQLKREGQGYEDQLTIPKANLTDAFYDVYLNMANFEDGAYRLRARANCESHGSTYSSELFGVIDRTSLAPFGMPSPSDGFLQEGQEVSVTFDKEIDCSLNSYDYEASLMRLDDSTEIVVTEVQCSNNKIILVTDPPLIDRPELAGVPVEAYLHLIQDLSGNVQKYPVQWSFLVNVKPVFWDPEEVYASSIYGQPFTIIGTLKNNSQLSKAFTLDVDDAPGIIEIPDWLTPLQTRGTVLASNDYSVEFIPDPDLLPGIYTGTVTAAVNGMPISMEITYELFAKPVNWTFNPNQYEKSMTVVTQFSLTAANAPLSTDTRDLVAAYVNGEIRGVANIRYVEELDTYAAFLTVYSNSTGGGGGETVRFKFWKALSGVEYGAVESMVFQPDGKVGSALNPLILHPEGIYQVIPLQQGWNWISLNVSTSNMSREKIFQSLIYPQATNVITIKSQSQTSSFSPGSGWQGNLQTLALGHGYLVHLSDHLDTLRTVGNPPAAPVAINVSNTWNWIGFPEQTPRDVDSVLAGLAPIAGNLLKGHHSFSEFTPANGWVGDLLQFEPGKGYKLQYPANGILQFRDLKEYSIEPGLFEFNMNVTGILNPVELNDADYRDLIVGAFIDGKCHGIAEVEYVPALNSYRVLLLAHGNADLREKQLQFRVFDRKTGQEFVATGEVLTFGTDDIRGTVLEPYVFFPEPPVVVDQDVFALRQNEPNPFSDITFIDFRIPHDARVKIDLYDVQGNMLRSIADVNARAGWQTIEADLTGISSGIYLYQLVTEGFSATRKLVKH